MLTEFKASAKRNAKRLQAIKTQLFRSGSVAITQHFSSDLAVTSQPILQRFNDECAMIP
jgi:hypothetical protein